MPEATSPILGSHVGGGGLCLLSSEILPSLEHPEVRRGLDLHLCPLELPSLEAGLAASTPVPQTQTRSVGSPWEPHRKEPRPRPKSVCVLTTPPGTAEKGSEVPGRTPPPIPDSVLKPFSPPESSWVAPPWPLFFCAAITTPHSLCLPALPWKRSPQ